MVKNTQDTPLVAEDIHQPCEDCGSSDGLTVNVDGSTKCYACDKFTPSNKSKRGDETFSASKKSKDLLSGSFNDIPARKITKETCQKWGVEMVSTQAGKKALAFPYYNKRRSKVAQKLRFADKTFSFIGDTKNPKLFGQQLWSKGKKIIITEGEIDALSVSQIQNHKWPVVSLPNGASSAKAN